MKLTLIVAQSLDGFITKHGQSGSDFVSEADRGHLKEALSHFDFYLMGAETYRVIRSTLLPKLKPGLLRIVLTRNPDAFQSDAIAGVLEFTSENPTALITRLKTGGKKAGALLGGSQLYRLCLAQNLVSQCWVTVEPRLFGRGKPLLGHEMDVSLALCEHQRLSADTLLLKYDVKSVQVTPPACHWSLYFLAWVCSIIALGAVLGVITFPLGGWIISSEKTPLELLSKGARMMSFYFAIWAPAIALVATLAREYRRRR